jgi:hypothetical protein
MDDMEYPERVQVVDSQRQLERAAQQKICHAASLYELHLMDGRQVNIDVYAQLMYEAGLMTLESGPHDHPIATFSYNDAMALFVAVQQVGQIIFLICTNDMPMRL